MSARLLLISAVLAALSGCALKPVQPWEKGELSRTDMLIQGDGLETRFNEHIYTSKEAASGGSAVGGGGCGCN
ncbi:MULTISPECIES: DUF4266 domain-containing protein [unclassified Duganella]|uniref:DUF4266 domain-containing protein n=1 Tax=unclassified Duganella TaxID=2636909 RepID=UPI0006F885BF|nr:MULTISPECIES: DUF4266 domain-containing protein [unclassified Duganella]KQV61849.1 hypothetical protein ASD07_03200 [Duganella sp. Root336D2]KRB84357.1 hypothetical protein ASE26_09875 [Duganella sp. Root198D2]